MAAPFHCLLLVSWYPGLISSHCAATFQHSFRTRPSRPLKSCYRQRTMFQWFSNALCRFYQLALFLFISSVKLKLSFPLEFINMRLSVSVVSNWNGDACQGNPHRLEMTVSRDNLWTHIIAAFSEYNALLINNSSCFMKAVMIKLGNSPLSFHLFSWFSSQIPSQTFLPAAEVLMLLDWNCFIGSGFV